MKVKIFFEMMETEEKAVTKCRLFLIPKYFDGEFAFYGIAKKNPKDDNNESIGRKVALTRTVANLPKPLRKRVWQHYLHYWGV